MLTIKFFPNGEFTHGVSPTPKKSPATANPRRKFLPDDRSLAECVRDLEHRRDGIAISKIEAIGQKYTARDGSQVEILNVELDGVTLYSTGTRGNYTYKTPYTIGMMVSRGDLIPLDYQASQSSIGPARSRKQLPQMTRNMGRNIRQACYLLDQTARRNTLGFLTLTLPGLSEEDLGKCCENWGTMVNHLLTWMRYELKQIEREFTYVYCTEIQQKRRDRTGSIAPHLHMGYIARGHSSESWYFSPGEIRSKWAKIISGIIGHSDFCTTALENLQPIKFSIGRYLSKYLGKGVSLPSDGEQGTNVSAPAIGRLHTQWGGMARALSRFIVRCTTRLQGAYNSLAQGICEAMGRAFEYGYIPYYQRLFIPLSTDSYGVERGLHGGVGRLPTPTYQGGVADFIEFAIEMGMLHTDLEMSSLDSRMVY